ncbi:hypothetical protein CQW23_26908 [Capsicum baccatum]|uniref:HMA domain-containing protein n=1 Tax=Capsicum baccatum TaxID=33114 RepID=A0A2G2VQ52_CAPBA|nr:hypothetical protein CQW23_26908 [Capsicum baccatum]
MAEIALAVGCVVGGAFLNVLFERIASWVELLKKNKNDDRLLEKLEDILLGLQIERSAAENKQASDPLVRKWLNKLQHDVNVDANLLEEVNYEALRLKVEGQLRNLEEKSNQQDQVHPRFGLPLHAPVPVGPGREGGVRVGKSPTLAREWTGGLRQPELKEKLEDTIETLELMEKQIGRLGLQKHLDSERLIDRLTSNLDLRQNKKSTKKNEGGEKKKKGGGEENKKDGGNLSVVLKSCNCEGCATKVVKAISSVGGVEKVMCDVDSKKLTVIGKVDPVMLREEVERKTQKNVEVVSPIPKKDGKGKGGGNNGSDNGAGEEKKKMQKQNKEKDSRENTGGEDKKNKEKEKKSTKKNEGGEKNKKEGGEENKKDGGNLTAILKSCQCEGCVSTVVKAIRSIGGVEKVMCDVDSKKLTVIGKVDPVMLREEVERKTQKNVEVVSPIPKKDSKGKGGGDNGSDNGAGEEKKKMQKQNKEKDSRENTGGKKPKEKELPITTVVLKLHCHCQGCIQKIDEIMTKFKGYKEMKVDEQKDLVTVTGSMDMKVLAETLKKHLKKEIEIVPPKKEGGENEEKGGGDNGGGGGKGKGAGVGAMAQTVIISWYLWVLQISEMEIGFAVGGAFLSSSLNVLFDRLAPHGDLLKMFQKHKHDDGLLEKLEGILLGLQIVLSDAENKKASNPLVRKWLNKLQRAMDGAESLLEEVNYEALRLKVEDQLQNLAETSNQHKACYSESIICLRNTKGLLQEVGSFDLKDDNNVNQLQVKLKESLKGKRFLVVLDDCNEWDDFRNLFVKGSMGSKIMVTTRKENVAWMMDSGAINVGTLSSEVSWALFKRHSLKNRDPEEHPELEEVGKQIADNCKGLPLALKALAGILRHKSEVDEWKEILRSEIWEQNLNGILPALMLSYNDLPTHLKQCFAYCAIYPKDYQFCKEQVNYLWIANGLVQQLHSGNQYFNELRSRSLLERVPESSERDGRKFLMHDLVNDLAQTASSKLCVRLEECQGSHILEQSRHMSYSVGKGGDFVKLKPLIKSEQLRTLVAIDIQHPYNPKLIKRVLHNILPRLTSLKALSLSCYENMELPNDLFIKLKILRFWTFLRHMEKLINLRHLDISKTSRLKMPLHLSKLKSLQVLVGAEFLLGGSGGWRMEDLGGAHYLYGSLSILELQNVVDRREALKAKMRDKNHVEKLSFEWSESDADNSQTEREILDELCPHTNIKELQISGYRGTQFPNWLANHSFLKLLVQLSLSNCMDCFSFPALGQLPSLKFLSIRGML